MMTRAIISPAHGARDPGNVMPAEATDAVSVNIVMALESLNINA